MHQNVTLYVYVCCLSCYLISHNCTFLFCLSNVLSVTQDCNPKSPLQAPVYCISKISLFVIYYSLVSVWGKNFSYVMFLVSLCVLYIYIYINCTLSVT